MDWDHGSEEADQYRISWVPSGGGDKKEMIINGNETSQVLDNLDPDTKYDVSLTAIYPDKKESDDVSASERTSTIPAPSNLRFSDITRKSFRMDWDHGSEEADQYRISWVPSGGGDKKEMIINGKETSQVLDNLDPDTKYDVSLTAIYPDKTESDDILGSQRTSVVPAPSNLRFSDVKGYSFRLDWDHGSEEADQYRISWVPSGGGDKKEMIINGNETCQVLDNLDPDTKYNVSLTAIYTDKTESDDIFKFQRTSTIPAPSNLRFSDITRNSFRMNWDHGSEEADQYRVSWVPSAGGDKKEKIFNGNETIQVLDNLDPDTSYDVTLTAIYPDKKESEDVLGSEHTFRQAVTLLHQSPQVARVPEGGTVKLTCNMRRINPRYTVDRYDVHWSFPGENKYIVRHYITGKVERVSHRFQPSRDIAGNSYILIISGLTLRDSAVYICGVWGILFGNGTRLIVTRNVPPPSNLRFSDITRKGFRMDWDHGSDDVDQYRISWVPSAGGDRKEIIIHGNEENYVFDNLDPDTKYNVSLTAIFPDKTESAEVFSSEHTLTVPAPSNLRFSDVKGYNFQMHWDHGREEADLFRISWVPSAGGDKKEMVINGNETSQVLDNLDPDTLYDVSLTAIYPDKVESDGLLGSQRTAVVQPPSNLRFSVISRKSFRMDWDHGSEEADQYRISWVPSGGGDKKEMIINGKETSHVLDNLDPDTKYDVSLTAIYPNKKESDDVSASQRTSVVQPPSNLQLSDVTRKGFRMDWDHAAEDVDKYRINWVPSGGGDKKEMIINGNETSQVLDNLDPDTLYDVSLTAIYPDKTESDGVTASQRTATIPAPSNLRFSDITRKSFRMDWDHGSEEADQYKISWVPSAGGDKKEMIINGKETSQVFDNLDPDTKYDVFLTAIYPDKKESDDVSASQRTSTIPAPSNLRFSNITRKSFRMDWDHGSEEADQYRISWVPSAGGDKKEMIINGKETSQVLDNLDPDTKYDVSLTAIYPDKKESDEVLGSEHTSTIPAPSNLRFSDITRKSFLMDWDHGSEEADKYRISWVPSAGGDKKEMIINGKETSQVLDNLDPDTKYDVFLTAIYPDKKESIDVLGSERTSVVPAPSNLRFSDIKGYSFRMDWDHGSEEADQYRISWVPSGGGDKKEMMINGKETSQVLDNLDPDTKYDVSLTAIYPDKKESDDVLGSEHTSVVQPPSNLRFSVISRKSFRMDWDHGSEAAEKYRISWVPSAGGDKKEMIINGNETSQLLDNLDPDTLYDVTLTAIYPNKKESDHVSASQRTSVVAPPSNLRFSDIRRKGFRIDWDHGAEDVDQYRISWVPSAGGDKKEMIINGKETSQVLDNLDPDTKYDVFLTAIYPDKTESIDVLGSERTSVVAPPSNLRFSDITRKGFRMDWDHGAEDVDQYRISWVPSAGGDKKEMIINGKETSQVLDNLDPDTKYDVFLTAIYPDKTESIDVLGSERTSVVAPPSNLRFSDIRRKGFRMDWDHGAEDVDQYRISWVPSAGGDKKEMIINGKETSQVLDNLDPDTKYDVFLTAIYPDKTESIDVLGSERTSVVAPPSNLRFSDITRKGFRMDWDHGAEDVDQYRISWVPSAGGDKKEMIINGKETSQVLDNLDPDTKYDVFLTAIYPDKTESIDVLGSERTSVAAPPSNLRFSDITRKGFRMDWDHGAEDVDQYRISWVPSAGGDKKEMVINGKETSQVFDNLDPDTKYDVFLTAIYPDKTESIDVLGSEHTSVVPAPSNLRFSDIKGYSFRMDWDHGSEEADQYRISWVPSAGGDKKEMMINGKETSQVLDNLDPDTKYDVSLTAIYPDKKESDDVLGSEHTSVVQPPSNLRFSVISRKSFRMDWDHGSEAADKYRISWVPSAGGDKKEMIINGNETSQLLDNLDPDTLYDVTLTAIYPNKKESDHVSASQRTSVVAPPSNLRFSDITRKGFRMDWDHGAEDVDQYRISWVPSAGGDKKEMIINGNETSQFLDNLDPDTLYDVTLTAIYPNKKESDDVSASQRTSAVHLPSNLRFSDISRKSFRMDWDHGAEEADQYRISWVPSAGGDKKEMIINGKETSHIFDNLDPDTKYDVSLTAIYPDKTESDDVSASQHTSVVAPPSNLRFSDITRKGFRMDWDHGAEDVDQYRISWVPSAGGDKKEMIINGKETSQVFDNLDPDTKYDVFLTAIYPDKTESIDVLGSERTSVVAPPSNLRFSDITRKGFRMDWDHGAEDVDQYRISWVPSAGGDKKEMIINGKETSQVFDNLDPDTKYDVFLTAIYPDKTESIDVLGSERTSVVAPPSNLRFSDITRKGFRMDWDHGSEEADQYRISWVPSAGGDKKEMIINGKETSQVFDNLDPDTKYDVFLTAIYPDKTESIDVLGSERTSVVAPPSNLRFSDITRKGFRMDWDHGAEDVDQYRISWVPSAGGDKKEMIINGKETSQVFDNLDPDTKYDVSLTAIYPDKTESIDVLGSERTSVVAPPSNLRFSDITRKGFRMDWDHGSEEADQYRISWVPSAGGDKKEMIINGKETSQVLDNLDPDTKYDVSLTAIYPDKTESIDVLGSERTSVIPAPSNLRFSDIKGYSFRMDWDHGSEDVDQYRISWVPSGGGDKKKMIVNGKETSQVLDNLDPDTKYDVSLTAIYPDKKESDDVLGSEHTSVVQPPSNLRFSVISRKGFRMDWDHGSEAADQYRISWVPSAGGDKKEMIINGNETSQVLDNLDPDTLYDVTLTAIYPNKKESDDVSASQRTSAVHLPSNLRFSDITRKSFRMDWDHGSEEADQYRISWVPSAGGDKKETIINGKETSHVLDNLDPDTKYDVSLTAIYPDKTESDDVSASQHTSTIPAPSNLRFSDITRKSFRMDWDHGSEEVDQYRISWVPSAGGDKKEMIINGKETSQILDNLDPDTKYDVTLTAIYPDKKESDAALGSEHTSVVQLPSNLRFSDISRKSFRMDWDHGSEEADQYRISWVPSGGGDKKEMIINGKETSQVLDNLDPDTKYDVTLTAIYPDKTESDGVSASQRTSVVQPPSNLRFSDITGNSFRMDWDHGSEEADQYRISWVPSGGGDKKEMIINGNETSHVLDNLDPDTLYDVSLTAIYPDKKESDDVSASQRTSVDQPPSNLRFSDITRKSFRMDWDHGSEEADQYRISWVPSGGGDKKEMIINGKESSQVLDNLDPDTLYDVSLTAIYPNKKESDEVSASQRTSVFQPPSNLRFSDITRKSFRMDWDHGSEEADQYRISWVPSAGGDKKEMIINGKETSQVLDNLDPDTLYDVTLTAIYPNKKESDDISASQRTSVDQPPSNLRFSDITRKSFRVDWDHGSEEADQYRISWVPSGGGDKKEMIINGNETSQVLDNLDPDTLYDVTLTAIYPNKKESDDVSASQRTSVDQPPSNLRFSDITRKSFRVDWDHGSEEADQYRISWVPSAGGDKKEMIINGNETSQVLDNLDPDTLYDVTLTAIYPNKKESDEVSASQRTSVDQPPSNLRFSDITRKSFRVDWDHGSEEADQYRISWVPSAGGDKKEMIINGNETSQVLDNLDPDTLYDVTLTAIYPNKKESDEVSASQRTSVDQPPSNLRFSDITRKSFRVDWDHGSEEVDQYRISWVPSAGGDKKEMIINGNETSQVLDNLDPDTLYDVTLTAIYPNKKESDEVSASQRTSVDQPPSNLRFSDITRKSFRVDWDHGSEEADQYRISWVPSAGGDKKEMIINGNETSQVLDNLDPDTLYDVTLTAIYPNKKESDEVSASQRTSVDQPPSNLRFSDITRKSFRVDWDHGSEEADQYRISWVPSAGGDKKEMIINGNETSQVLDNLDPDTLYDVTLTAIYPNKKESDEVSASQRTSVDQPPSNLRFSDITRKSFRVDWDHGSEEADQYRISWVPSAGGDKKEMIINGNETSQVLDNLDPDTLYDVTLTAIYPNKKESDEVSASQRTSVDQPPSNLRFSDITRKSFRMDWDHGSEEADQYRISWVPSGGGDKKEMIKNGNETSQVLDNLDPDTLYDVTLTAIYPNKKESDDVSASQRTSVDQPPSNLRFSDITRKSFRVDWDHGSEEADQYRISWVPSGGGDKKEMIINGNETSQVLDNLDPDTLYDVSLTAIYPDKKESDDVSASQRTSVVQPPSNLRFSDITGNSFRMDWDHGSEEADQYRISWVPSGGGDKKEMIINGNETSHVLDNLDPDTLYDVSLTAIYPDKKESDGVTASQRTSGGPAPSNLRFSDITGNSFRMDWDHGSEEVDQYRLSWVPSGGGDKKEMIINGNETSQVLDKLDPDTLYDVSLTAIYPDKTESEDVLASQRTYKDKLGPTLILPILTLAVMTYVASKILAKEGIVCQKPSLYSPAPDLTCGIR
ncbi:tenascin-X-like [Scyliorhinus canicula]|uniref:tenascin-X-like n=1 Tax=Scyliorhinus canicula TaxID=7830 RepID=UPI0018F6DD09|nr:tenascin-X-like [Scyliorhinus canicula]